MMRMPADENLLLGVGPRTEPPLDPLTRPRVVLPVESYHLQAAPDTADDHPSQEIEPIVGEIGLMTVNREDPSPRFNVFQDQPLTGQQAVFFDQMLPKSTNIVVAQQHVQTFLVIEAVQQIENSAVGFTHDIEAPVLPELITVANFNVGEALSIVVLEHIDKEPCISCKAIGYAAISPMTVTEEYQARSIIKKHLTRRRKNPRQLSL
jgi:hypothetical protein